MTLFHVFLYFSDTLKTRFIAVKIDSDKLHENVYKMIKLWWIYELTYKSTETTLLVQNSRKLKTWQEKVFYTDLPILRFVFTIIPSLKHWNTLDTDYLKDRQTLQCNQYNLLMIVNLLILFF